MKNFFGSIANRVFVILLAGILVAAAVTTLLAEREREGAIEQMRAAHSADRVAQLVQALDEASPALRPVILRTAANFGMRASIADDLEPAGETDGALVALLRARLGPTRQIALKAQSGCPPLAVQRPRFDRPRETDCQLLMLGLADGQLLRVQLHAPNWPGHVRPPPGLAAGGSGWYLALFLALIGLLAYLVAQMTARPIRRLAEAAGALGSDLDRAPLVESGPTEIRQAAAAFNAMQGRIRRQVQHRTHMLAAITHDLQTPLTRLRLRFEKVGDAELRQKLVDDLAVMQSMVREGLDLARSMDSHEAPQRLDLNSLVDSVCADASDAGQNVVYQGTAGVFVLAQPGALRRCLTNLIDNACKYGKLARVESRREQDSALIRISDAGPGLQPDQLEAVFDPFFRLEASRSRDTGGTGLGLTIARNIAESHGGGLVLQNGQHGGLEALLRLPIKP